MTTFRSRTGQPMELMDWARAYEEESIRVVARTTVNQMTVSTIWEGIVLPWRGIFETALINPTGEIVKRWHSHTEEEAKATHARVVAEEGNSDAR